MTQSKSSTELGSPNKRQTKIFSSISDLNTGRDIAMSISKNIPALHLAACQL